MGARVGLAGGTAAGLLLGSAAGAGSQAAASTPPFTVDTASAPAPAPYQSSYDQMASEVSAFATEPRPRPVGGSTTIGAELLAANGNIGSGLLDPGALSGVRQELASYQTLGVQGVTVDVSFPLLLSSTSEHGAFLSFYEKVAQLVRERHMALSVEENPVFSGTPLTTLHVSYAGLTLSKYAQEQRQQAQVIINDLRPAYLSILTEPDTYTDTVRVNVDSPQAAVQVVRGELRGLDRRHTKVGAGTGTWSPTAIDRALASQTSINYLDVHVFPIGPAQLSNLTTDVATAHHARKPLVMDETWLNKPSPGQTAGPAGAPAQLQVKSYSFWEPLDEQYVTAMASYVRSQGFAYTSFFDGARAFFAYLTWSPTLQAASYQSFSTHYNRAVAAAMRSGTVTGTGLALYQALHTS